MCSLAARSRIDDATLPLRKVRESVSEALYKELYTKLDDGLSKERRAHFATDATRADDPKCLNRIKVCGSRRDRLVGITSRNNTGFIIN
jgi:hypothetical protein